MSMKSEMTIGIETCAKSDHPFDGRAAALLREKRIAATSMRSFAATFQVRDGIITLSGNIRCEWPGASALKAFQVNELNWRPSVPIMQTEASVAHPMSSELELVKQCQRGDSTAFDELVVRYRTRFFGMIYNMVHNEQDAGILPKTFS